MVEANAAASSAHLAILLDRAAAFYDQAYRLREAANNVYRQTYSNETAVERHARMCLDDQWLEEDDKVCSMEGHCWYHNNTEETMLSYRLKGTDIYLCDECRDRYMASATVTAIINASLTPHSVVTSIPSRQTDA